ncbi:MAG: helix-turn-helix transcriptional regulator, partial [Chitinophagaceae bacterium]
ITVAPNEKPQKVLLSFTPQQGKYIKAQPLHESQEIIKDNNHECRVSLLLVINTELIMILLSYGSKVKVIQPKSLAERVMKEALAMKELYKGT